MCACACVFVLAEALKSRLDQGQEKTSKVKQLLVKTKKELADAKMQVRFYVCGCVYVSARMWCKCVPLDFLFLCVTLLPDYCK